MRVVPEFVRDDGVDLLGRAPGQQRVRDEQAPRSDDAHERGVGVVAVRSEDPFVQAGEPEVGARRQGVQAPGDGFVAQRTHARRQQDDPRRQQHRHARQRQYRERQAHTGKPRDTSREPGEDPPGQAAGEHEQKPVSQVIAAGARGR